MKLDKTALVILSGGQDSATTLFWALSRYQRVRAITFVYNQRHEIEVDCAVNLSIKTGTDLKIVEIPFLTTLVKSALTTHGEDVNVRHARHPELPASFVPIRNALFITLAHGFAQEIGAEVLIMGVCQTDFSGYPDCRRVFIRSMQNALNIGYNQQIQIETPLMDLDKADTFRLAEELGCLEDIIEMTHTCYIGDHDTKHPWGYGCGECPACKLRAKGWEIYQNRLANGFYQSPVAHKFFPAS